MKINFTLDAPVKGQIIEKEIHGTKIVFQILEVSKRETVQKQCAKKTREELIQSLHSKLGKLKKGNVLKYEDPFGSAIPLEEWGLDKE
jgi:hypothetical protein